MHGCCRTTGTAANPVKCVSEEPVLLLHDPMPPPALQLFCCTVHWFRGDCTWPAHGDIPMDPADAAAIAPLVQTSMLTPASQQMPRPMNLAVTHNTDLDVEVERIVPSDWWLLCTVQSASKRIIGKYVCQLKSIDDDDYEMTLLRVARKEEFVFVWSSTAADVDCIGYMQIIKELSMPQCNRRGHLFFAAREVRPSITLLQ